MQWLTAPFFSPRLFPHKTTARLFPYILSSTCIRAPKRNTVPSRASLSGSLSQNDYAAFSVSFECICFVEVFCFSDQSYSTILFEFLMFPFGDDFTKIVFKKVPFNYS